jgi:hypothetical protein
MMLFRHPVICPTAILRPARILPGFFPYFLAEHRTIFVWLFLCGLSVACADALVAVFIGKMVGFVGQADRWAAWHERWPALSPASGHRRCPAFSGSGLIFSSEFISYSRRDLADAVDQLLARGSAKLEFLSGRSRGDSLTG